MLVKAIFNSVPGTSCGRTSRSKDFKVLSSLPYLAFAPRIAWRTSGFLGLVKYITIFPFSVRSPNAESSSVCMEVGASSTSERRKMSLTVACSLRPGTTSCFFVVVTCTNWLPTLMTTSIFPFVFESLMIGWNTYLVSVTTLIVSFGKCN
jgi:hypothetical protein